MSWYIFFEILLLCLLILKLSTFNFLLKMFYSGPQLFLIAKISYADLNTRRIQFARENWGWGRKFVLFTVFHFWLGTIRNQDTLRLKPHSHGKIPDSEQSSWGCL